MSASGSPEPTTAQTLCLSCGACCMGVLHDHGTLEPEDAEVAARLRLPVFTHASGRQAFTMPCPCYKDDKCSTYPDRPVMCGAYECHVLGRHQRGALSFEQASALTKELRELMAALHEQMDEALDPSRSVWDQAEAFEARQRSAMEAIQLVRTQGEFLRTRTRLFGLVRREFLPRSGNREPGS